MDYIVINGQRRLSGEVYINGAKNASLAIIPAALASGNVCVIENLANIKDVTSFVTAITKMGVKCEFVDKHTLRIDSRNITSCRADFDALRKIRASYYLVGVLLGKYKRAEVVLPGGCDLGVRPIDQHIKGFEALGAKVVIEHGMVVATADKLVGANIFMDVVSVGATINIMLASIFAEGVTVIENAAKEPHVVDTANFLNLLGANIKGAGTPVIRITGVKDLHGGQYMVIPDQIQAGTYMIAAAATQGDVKVRNIIPKHMDSLSAKLTEMNCQVIEDDDSIRVIGSGDLIGCNVKTLVYPGFPTDLQPQMTSLLCAAKGTSILTETVFENRYQYINELNRLGAHVTVEGRVAFIEGPRDLSGTTVTATDLRAGAALVIAGLAAKGETRIGNVKYIDRGYECLDENLRNLGADIKRASIND